MKKDTVFLSLTVLVCCVCMAAVDGLWKPDYWLKSAIKVLLFLTIPLVFALVRKLPIRELLLPDKKAIALGAGLGVGAFLVIVAGYFAIRGIVDFSFIPGALMENGGISAENFLYVSAYIALCNSLLEEFFFRGFAFLTLKKLTSPVYAYCFSAGAFALYHAGMLDGWFSPGLFLLTLAALFAGGLFLNFLNHGRGRLWVSWLAHMGANLGINTVGMILLGVL